MKKTFVVNMDTETANTLCVNGKLNMDNVLVYDIGWSVIDLHGNTYESKSYIVDEIFNDMPDLMTSAYYAEKIPQYLEDIENGSRMVASFYEIRKDLLDTMERYGTKIVCCHNTRFDKNALTISQRYITKSKYRYFFPFETEYWDTMKMASDVILPMKSYRKFCEENGYMTKHKTPRPRMTAEILYRFIAKDKGFIESHTALEDVMIESEIMWYCFRKHKKMRKGLYE